MLALPGPYWAIAPDQRGYGDADITKKVDATRGAGDWADDVIALVDHLGIEKVHVVGCSMGGYVIWQLMADHPQRLQSIVLVNPVSPFGFSGTKDLKGTPCFNDFAGTGGGLRNQEMIEKVLEGDRGLGSGSSPRVCLRGLFIPPFLPPREEELLSSVLATHIGGAGYPG
jgi:pimeloyl-ACP methyl ester carboxylesterase